MKWFKHYSDAGEDDKVQAIIDEIGIDKGYAAYFRLLELCAAMWDGKSEPKFKINPRVLRQKLHLSSKTFEKFLTISSEVSALSYEIYEKFIEIRIPKLANIRDNATRNLQVTCKELAPRTDKNRIDKNRIDNINTNAVFDLELIYKSYPRKSGKSAGLEKLAKIVKSQSDYDATLKAVREFAKNMSTRPTDKIPYFSTFVNKQLQDYVNGDFDEITKIKSKVELVSDHNMNMIKKLEGEIG